MRCVRPDQLLHVLDRLPIYKILWVGLVNGRNVALRSWSQRWHNCNLPRNVLATTCGSAVPVRCCTARWIVEREDKLDPELKSWLAFAVQKCGEIAVLRDALNDPAGAQGASGPGRKSRHSVQPRRVATHPQSCSAGTYRGDRPQPQPTSFAVCQAHRTAACKPETADISDHHHWLVSADGSIRLARQAYKQGKLSANDYTDAMRHEIRHAVQIQERLGLDVLVHGEAERNDMVEYFAEQLDGYCLHPFRLGAELRFALRETGDHLW